MVDSDKIKGRMREKRITQKQLAEKLMISQPVLCQRLNNVRKFNIDEIANISLILDLNADEVYIFFILPIAKCNECNKLI